MVSPGCSVESLLTHRLEAKDRIGPSQRRPAADRVYCKSTSGAVRPFQRLVERNKPQPTDPIFPKTHRQLFNTILDEENLKKDREGQPRTAYSLRHTYICLRLMEGADIYQIAKNCRTSVEMIEKYYASHLKNSLDAAAINIRRPKTKKKDEPPTEPEE